MKYKLLKYIEKEEDSIKIWETFETDCTYVKIDNDWRIDIRFLIREWYIEEVVEKIDFSKFIWRDKNSLVIKWDNLLKSWSDWAISYYKGLTADDKLNYI